MQGSYRRTKGHRRSGDEGSALPLLVSARGKAATVPPRGPTGGRSFIYSLLLFILCLVFAEDCSSAHTHYPCFALGAGACQDSRWTTAWSPFKHPPELTAGPGALSPPPGTKDQPGPPSLLPEQLRLPSVSRRTFQQLKWLKGSEESMKGDKQAGV